MESKFNFKLLNDLVEKECKERGIKRYQLAEELGISQTLFSQHTNGRLDCEVNSKAAITYAKHYNVSLDVLFGLEEEESKVENKQTKIMSDAIWWYGVNHQKNKAIEELSELIQAISKDITGETNINNIAEEIADVTIMLEQLKMIYQKQSDPFDFNAKVDEVIDIKLERLNFNMHKEERGVDNV